MQELTETQTRQLQSLAAESQIAAKKINIVMLLMLFVTMVTVNILNQLFIQNDYFVVLMSFTSGFLVLRHAVMEGKTLRSNIRVKIQEILDNR
jgi:hypothetical protein